MQTLIGLPSAFEQRCDIVVNDMDIEVVLRNAILLLLAISFPD